MANCDPKVTLILHAISIFKFHVSKETTVVIIINVEIIICLVWKAAGELASCVSPNLYNYSSVIHSAPPPSVCL